MRPGKRARVRSQAMSTANGRLKATLRRATSRLRRRASSSAELGTVGSEERYEQPGGAADVRRHVGEQCRSEHSAEDSREQEREEYPTIDVAEPGVGGARDARGDRLRGAKADRDRP